MLNCNHDCSWCDKSLLCEEKFKVVHTPDIKIDKKEDKKNLDNIITKK